MIEDVLYQVSRTAAMAMVLIGLSAVCTGLIAILTSHMPGDRRSEPAAKLTRLLSVVGAGLAIAAGLTAIPYRWMIGDIDMNTFLVVEGGLLVLLALWAVGAAAVLPVRRVRSR